MPPCPGLSLQSGRHGLRHSPSYAEPQRCVRGRPPAGKEIFSTGVLVTPCFQSVTVAGIILLGDWIHTVSCKDLLCVNNRTG